MGWQQRGPKWIHDSLGVRFCLPGVDGEKSVDEILHLIRMSWRWLQFRTFCAQNRRDARLCRHVVYDESRVKVAQRWFRLSPAHAAILTGGFVSPAAVASRPGSDACPACPWCSKVCSFDHLARECTGLMRARPCLDVGVDVLSYRCGWPRPGGVAKQASLNWLSFLVFVRTALAVA